MLDYPLLHLESSGPKCSIALSNADVLVEHQTSDLEKQHIGQLAVMVDSLLKRHELSIQSLKAISLSAGPGSYTGLRVAYALVKGLVFETQTPIVTVPTYEALIYGLDKETRDLGTKVILHARKEEYIIYDFDSDRLFLSQTEVNYSDLLELTSKFEGVLVSDNRIDGISNVEISLRSAINLIHPAYDRCLKEEFEAPERISPIYYKPPYITTRKRKLI